ncbi:hypothetical protein NL533_32265, partial [Klebsiella pneumoniae]|nr:hypothetical protein [Klebsiella pneumoniae]
MRKPQRPRDKPLVACNAATWWPPALALAAALLLPATAWSQDQTLTEKIQLCSTCHGEDGNSKIENIP